MKSIAICLTLLLATCGTQTTTVPAVDAAKIAYDARAAYAGGLILATTYANLPRCPATAPATPCSDPAVLDQMKKADIAADTATSAAENAVRVLGNNPTVMQAAAEAAKAAVAAFTSITNTYAPKGAK